ncbi:hypothetical protein SAMN05216241_102375 [Limimonas halophila]|uniref:Uncharacterized protein n=1 Tax=Limimonas halophila TaxID=1082479 RepID=A0A1G7NZA4_9PROT|nr:hypothetical protein [Limimonas halophila]SDF79382.1 hypothetical protein SAMN05216241_102375 [Limimonas halophila]
MTGLFADRDVKTLSAGAQLTLWCVRVWVRHMHEREPAMPCLRRGLDLAGVPDGLEEIHAVLDLIGRTAEGKLSFGGCRCRPVTADESCVLAAIQTAQAGDRVTATRYFGAWMPPVAARDAALHAARFGRCLDAAEMPVGLAWDRSPARRRLH